MAYAMLGRLVRWPFEEIELEVISDFAERPETGGGKLILCSDSVYRTRWTLAANSGS